MLIKHLEWSEDATPSAWSGADIIMYEDMSDNEASVFLAFASPVWHHVHGDDAHGGDGGGGVPSPAKHFRSSSSSCLFRSDRTATVSYRRRKLKAR